MIEPLSAPDHVAAFRISGTLTEADYGAIVPALEEKLREHSYIGVLADLTDLGDMTIDAIRRDIGYGMSKFGQWHRFRRVAVITDQRWIGSATKLTDALFPQVEARVFGPDANAAAMSWAASSRDDRRGLGRRWMMGFAVAAIALLTFIALKAVRDRD